ncbi:hypothetical protein PPL_02080 [Heterostelium album PN500]|uniref:Ankyrin repeat protein n=1 Tax=Heterostelium pallidum (strain ATCC 26659 / Pp 5 / PN500) TaxID=670386 RepID=D3B1A9_HETP5|nr:hypothetical protein PPL_02080 [Heterostelium album PN500]EFA85083.1 hypothetical protein PPL_02080 [Heterostelium album PN500]|eukprot:XP_020437193.1 hypothetical protein PPL_02080 [Heterostelium album PN500]
MSDFNVLQAIKYGHSQILVSTPLEALADKNSINQSYLHFAAESGHESILRLLVMRAKLDVNAVDQYGMTPLHNACLENKHLAVSFLLANGAKVDPTDVNNETPLYLAALSGAPQCLQILLKHSASINHQTNTGNTALHIAIVNNNWECIDLLSQYDADHTIINKDKKSALMLWEESALSKKHKYLFTSKKDLIRLVESLDNQLNEKESKINELLKSISNLKLQQQQTIVQQPIVQQQIQPKPDYTNIINEIDNISNLITNLKSNFTK